MLIIDLFIGPCQTFKTHENRQQVKIINYSKKAPTQTFDRARIGPCQFLK